MAYIECPDTPTVLFGIVSFLSLTWWLRQSKTNVPPGPWGWPLLGCLPNFAVLKYRTGLPMPQLFDSLAKKYGPVFSLDFVGKPIVVLNTYKYVKEAFNHPSLSDRPDLQVEIGDGIHGPQGLGQSSGEPWKEQRRFTLTALRSFGVGKKSFEENISEEAQSLAEEITSLNGKAFDPCHFFNNASSNVICSVVFGKRFDYSDCDFERLTNLLNDNFQLASSGGLSMFLPIAKYLNGGSHKKMIKTRRGIKQFVMDIINEHKKDHISTDPRDYIDVYLDEMEQRQKSNRDFAVNDRNLPATVGNLFAAGTDTTSTTLRWAVLYMAAFPKIQDRVHQELDSITGRDRFPRLADKIELPFTCATLLEVQRIASIAPLGVPHMCGEDTTLGPYAIPKGALIMANLWAIHHDPDNWLNPDEFNPKRFLDEDGHLKEREQLIPFSIGRRICLGEHLAKMELYIFFTHLLHQFTIKKPDDSPPLSFTGEHGLTYAPQPFKLQFTSRD